MDIVPGAIPFCTVAGFWRLRCCSSSPEISSWLPLVSVKLKTGRLNAAELKKAGSFPAGPFRFALCTRVRSGNTSRVGSQKPASVLSFLAPMFSDREAFVVRDMRSLLVQQFRDDLGCAFAAPCKNAVKGTTMQRHTVIVQLSSLQGRRGSFAQKVCCGVVVSPRTAIAASMALNVLRQAPETCFVQRQSVANRFR